FSSRRRHTRFSRDWSSDVCSSDLKQLQCPQFIPRTTQRHGLGQAVNPHHFKLADNSQTVMRHRRTNSWNHGIEPFEFIAHVPDRSEERRVGKEGMSRSSASDLSTR